MGKTAHAIPVGEILWERTVAIVTSATQHSGRWSGLPSGREAIDRVDQGSYEAQRWYSLRSIGRYEMGRCLRSGIKYRYLG